MPRVVNGQRTCSASPPGPKHQYYEDDGLAVTGVSGRSCSGAIGRIVHAEEPFEIFLEAGRWIDIDAEACARLS